MGLAPIVVSELYHHLAVIATEGVSIVIVEQFAHTVLGISDLAVLLSDGVVKASGPAAEIGDDVLAGAYLGS
jgi:branched-chain amino acid transport system ATP-binding protein